MRNHINIIMGLSITLLVYGFCIVVSSFYKDHSMATGLPIIFTGFIGFSTARVLMMLNCTAEKSSEAD